MAATIELSALDLRQWVRPGDMVVWGQGGGEPLSLTEKLMTQRQEIGRFKAFIGLCYSPSADPQFADVVAFASYHGGNSNRRLVEAGKLDILPVHYSALPGILSGQVDVLLLQLAPPDEHGNYSLGLSHDYLIPLIDRARVVIAEVIDQVPWVHGERPIRESDIDAMVKTSRPPLEIPLRAGDAVDRAIAERAAALIDDGATLQLGIGALPAAILGALGGRRHLGIHSGALFDPVVDLIEAGAVDNSRKGIDVGVTIAGSLLGTRRLYALAANNPRIVMRSIAYTHDIEILASVNKLVSLNTAIEVDLTGAVNAEVADGRYIGAVGGAVDFIRGAHRSRGGIPIIALRSRARGKGKIVARLSGPTSTSRADAGVIVTEYGIADLRGLSLNERKRRMIDIAHPDDRAELERQPV